MSSMNFCELEKTMSFEKEIKKLAKVIKLYDKSDNWTNYNTCTFHDYKMPSFDDYVNAIFRRCTLGARNISRGCVIHSRMNMV